MLHPSHSTLGGHHGLLRRLHRLRGHHDGRLRRGLRPRRGGIPRLPAGRDAGPPHLRHAFLQPQVEGMDDQGRALRDGAGQAPLSRLRGPGPRRGALYRPPAHHRRPELADAALPASDPGERPGALGLRAGGGPGVRRAPRAGPFHARDRHAARRDLLRRAAALPEAGAGLPAEHPALPAGGRDGPGQDGAGAGLPGHHGGLSGDPGGAAPPDPQLAAGGGALPVAGPPSAGARDPGSDPLCPAGGGHLHHPLPAAAGVEGGAAGAGPAHGDL